MFASGPATRYDKALDQVYNALGKHGADHRLFDGSHDLVGNTGGHLGQASL